MLMRRPQDAGALTLLGIILSMTGKPAESVKTLQMASQIDQTSPAALIPLASVLLRMGRRGEAEAAARRAIERSPHEAEAYGVLSQSLMSQERFDEALQAIDESCRLDPKSAGAHNQRAAALLGLGRPDEAEESLRKAIRLAPGVPYFTMCLTSVLTKEGRLAEASEALQQALRHSPNEGELHFVLGQTLLAMAAIGSGSEVAAEGEQHIRRSIELNPRSSGAHLYLALRYESLGRFEEAKALFEKSIELEPNQGNAYMRLVRNGKTKESERGLVDRMESVAKRGSMAPSELAYLHYGLAKAHDDLGDVPAAMEHYETANRISYDQHMRAKPFSRDAYSERLALAKRIFTADVLSKARPGPEKRPTPILIVGVMRSGTTLLEQILSGHPDVSACSELPFWNQAGETTYRSTGILPTTETIEALADEYLDAVRTAAGPHARFGTDKAPHNYELLGLFHLAFPDAPIIYIRRHPVDTCLSIYMTPYGIPPEFAYDKENIAFVYEEHLKLMEHWRSALPPGRFLEVEYEELTADPEPAVRKVLAYCGLDWNDACLHPEKNAGVVNTPSRWQARQPVYRTSVDRWKRYEPWLGEFARLLR